jgi:hypothetical protein
MAGGSDCSTLGGSPGAQSKSVDMFSMDKGATLRRSAPGGSHLQDPAPSAGEIIGRYTVFSFHQDRGQSLPHSDRSQGLPFRLLQPP